MRALADRAEAAVDRLTAIHPIMPWLVGLAGLSLLPYLTGNEYTLYLMNFICLMVILSVGLNIVKGFAGQVTVGHVGLYAVGAYTAAILSLNFDFPFVMSVACAVVMTAACGVIVGIPSFRLEGAYLALATLGFAESIQIYTRVTNYLGASSGLSNIPAPQVGDYVFDTYGRYYFIVMPVTVLAVYCSFALLRSATGRAFKAVREDVVSAAAMGVNVRRTKLTAFVISAVYAGVAGGLYAHMTPGYIHPNNFTVIEMVTLLLMIVIGGIGHVWGGIIGAILVTIIADQTRELYFYRMLAFGGIIVLTVMYMPKGIGGIIDRYLTTSRFAELRERQHATRVADEAADAS